MVLALYVGACDCGGRCGSRLTERETHKDFAASEGMGVLDFELRVRVNQYSNVRVIAETPNGLHMTGRFVKASGGCSAPASKDPQAALANMGQMKLKSFEGDVKMKRIFFRNRTTGLCFLRFC